MKEECSMRKTWLIGLAILVVFGLAVSGCSNQPSAEEIVSRIKEVEASTEDAHAVVEFSLRAQGTDLELVAELWEKKPNKLRAEVLEASDESIVGATSVTDGERVWMYHPGENEVVTGDLGELGSEGEQFFSPRQAIDLVDEVTQWVLDTHKAKLVGEEEVEGIATYKLEFTPREGEETKLPIPVGGNVTLWVERERWIVLQAHLEGGTLGEGRMHVRSFEFNTGVPDGRFVFDIPVGAQVINVGDVGPTHVTLDEAEAQAEFDLLVPAYLPDGATLVEVVTVEGGFVLRYDHASVSFAVVQRPVSALGDSDEPSIGSVFASREISVRGQDANLIVDEARGNSLLSWREGGLSIEIAGSISQEEILKVAESLR
jgi:outer membrane lipoprotein-sorting protein